RQPAAGCSGRFLCTRRGRCKGARIEGDPPYLRQAADDAIKAGVFLLKPNLRELQELTGESLADERSQIAAARRLIDMGGAEIVALTLAEAGALFVARDDALHAKAPDVALVSGVGAGDSFVGG